MVTFVQATYALVTFVHISNISAVTGPILIKLFGPNFFGVIIFVDQNDKLSLDRGLLQGVSVLQTISMTNIEDGEEK